MDVRQIRRLLPERLVDQDRDGLRLRPIGRAPASCFATAVIDLAAPSWVALALLGYPVLHRAGAISLDDLAGALQLVFASVAGTGAHLWRW